MALFPADQALPELACEAVRIQLHALELHRPRQWGACWLPNQHWNLLDPVFRGGDDSPWISPRRPLAEPGSE